MRLCVNPRPNLYYQTPLSEIKVCAMPPPPSLFPIHKGLEYFCHKFWCLDFPICLSIQQVCGANWLFGPCTFHGNITLLANCWRTILEFLPIWGIMCFFIPCPLFKVYVSGSIGTELWFSEILRRNKVKVNCVVKVSHEVQTTKIII